MWKMASLPSGFLSKCLEGTSGGQNQQNQFVASALLHAELFRRDLHSVETEIRRLKLSSNRFQSQRQAIRRRFYPSRSDMEQKPG
jgi:hypothetical protein